MPRHPMARKGSRRCSEDDRSTRQCAVSRDLLPDSELLRFVVGPDGAPVLDLAGRLPGRGMYVCSDRASLSAFLSGTVRMRMPKGLILPQPESEQQLLKIGEQLSRRMIESVGLAKRAGGAQLGVDSLRHLLEEGVEPLVLLAADVADHTREKVERLLRMRGGVAPLDVLDRERLGAACGRGPVAVQTITVPGLYPRIRMDALRWRAFFMG
ncbi:MAG: DUF448 domain-containing protein [Magnetococcales bacterium]|nr:DUF448 domain-containing protein [Magnetococcales bacterium]